jgi:curved DNA-binding protein CbpA
VKPSEEDWELLGLEPGADIARIRRAYRERRSLYEPVALATYSLLDEDERTEMVARIDEAYERLLAHAPAAPPAPSQAPPPGLSAREEKPVGPPPDAQRHPGHALRHLRITRGMSLPEIAAETKIGVALLGQIEEERFGSLPAAVFVRGHVQQFARQIGAADPDELAKIYVAKMTHEHDDESE